MRLAIMQPYVFPYLGYHQLLRAADVFVFLDDVNFIKKGWINRNRILMNGQPGYFTIPIKDMSQNRSIRDSMIADDPSWQHKILSSIRHAYGKAPFFSEVFPLIDAIIDEARGSIADLAVASVRLACARAGVTTPMHRSSDLGLSSDLRGQDRILAICRAHRASMYINPFNGMDLYDPATFGRAGMELRFLRMTDVRYSQFISGAFEPDLSMIDVLMFNPPEALAELFARFELVEHEPAPA